MKTCSICNISKKASEFYKGRGYHGGVRPHCKLCAKGFTSQSSVATMERVERSRLRNRQYIWDFYLAHPCTDCGEGDPVVLELDHVRGDKVAGVSQLVHSCSSLKRIDAEIAKCEVVCANCHRRRTAITQHWYEGVTR